MAGEKIFIGPKLRELRHSRSLTQAEMAAQLDVSASYINLIERNQRPASLKFLLTLSDNFGLNWREFSKNTKGLALSDLRLITRDAAFGDNLPDIEELRAALDGAPNLVDGFVNIYNAYRAYGERLAELNEFIGPDENSTLGVEHGVHDYFRNNNNYFAEIEEAADDIVSRISADQGELYVSLREFLKSELGVEVKILRDEVLGSSLRYYDREKKQLVLSDGLDHTNRVFQMAHMIAFIGYLDLLNQQIPKSVHANELAATRCRVELANYFAAAIMMPYERFFEETQNTRYDIERLAARFSVSYEHVCHRLTTMQRPGKRGIPFFFLRVDRGGNVSKRFNITPIQLARFGGACPKLDVHYCFRVPGRILTQIVEMPDHSRYFTINRTVDRPSIRYSNQDKRLSVSIGCPVEYAADLVYGKSIDPSFTQMITPIGVNCRLCPRQGCEQRAHDPFHTSLTVDEDRRGITHFES